MYCISASFFQKQLEEKCSGTTVKGIKADRLETQSGKTKEITVSRVKTEEQYYIRMENTDFPALSIKAMYPENDITPGKLSVSAAPKKADSVFDAVIALEILKGYVDGTLKINGHLIGKVLSDDIDYDEDMVESLIEFWNNLLKLEEILKVNFDPKEKMSQEDYRFLEELSIMFIEKKMFVIKNLPCLYQ